MRIDVITNTDDEHHNARHLGIEGSFCRLVRLERRSIGDDDGNFGVVDISAEGFEHEFESFVRLCAPMIVPDTGFGGKKSSNVGCFVQLKGNLDRNMLHYYTCT